MRKLFSSLLCFLLIACSEIDADQAKNVADNYLRTRPDVDLTQLSAEVREEGNTWVVIYSPPPNRAGGGPVITVNKANGNIEKTVFYQ